jgi:hypothetical protein
MKIIKPAHILLLVALLGTTVLLGCSKAQTENKLSGRWSRVFVDDLSTTRVEEWEFLGGGDLNLYISQIGSPVDTIAGGYDLDSYNYVTLSGSSEDGFPLNYSGKWRIIKLKKGNMILTKQEDPGGLTFREFTKQ